MDQLRDPLFSSFSQKEFPLPEFMKQASEEPMTMFAYFDGIENHFPISTPGQVYLSKIYFEKNAHQIPERHRQSVGSAIDQAASLFGVDVKREMEKVATQEDAFNSFLADVNRFENFGHDVAPMEKRAAAINLLKRHNEFDEALRNRYVLSEKLKRYGGNHLSNDWHTHINHRIRLAPHEEARSMYQILLNDRDKTESTDPLTLVKLLTHFDRKYDMDRHYGSDLLDPCHSLLSSDPRPKKIVVIMSVDGHDYHDSHFDKLTEDHLKHFSDEMKSRVMKREGLHALPEHIKDILAGVLNAL